MCLVQLQHMHTLPWHRPQEGGCLFRAAYAACCTHFSALSLRCKVLLLSFWKPQIKARKVIHNFSTESWVLPRKWTDKTVTTHASLEPCPLPPETHPGTPLVVQGDAPLCGGLGRIRAYKWWWHTYCFRLLSCSYFVRLLNNRGLMFWFLIFNFKQKSTFILHAIR